MTKEQKETELTPEMEKTNKMFFEKFGANKIWVKPSKENVETIHAIWELMQESMQAIKKETEQSLKQKVEKMLEGMIKRNEEAPPADKEEEIDERAYRQALEEAKNNLEDL